MLGHLHETFNSLSIQNLIYWFGHHPRDTPYVVGVARIAKLLEFLAGSVIAMDLVGIDKLKAWIAKREIRLEPANVPARDRFRAWVSDLFSLRSPRIMLAILAIAAIATSITVIANPTPFVPEPILRSNIYLSIDEQDELKENAGTFWNSLLEAPPQFLRADTSDIPNSLRKLKPGSELYKQTIARRLEVWKEWRAYYRKVNSPSKVTPLSIGADMILVIGLTIFVLALASVISTGLVRWAVNVMVTAKDDPKKSFTKLAFYALIIGFILDFATF